MIAVFLLAGILSVVPQGPDSILVRQVAVEGNVRVPDATILRRISTTTARPFDQSRAEQDLRRLFELGVFRNVDVRTRPTGDGRVDVVYHVEEHPFVSSFEIVGVKQGLEDQIRRALQKEKLMIRPATPFRPETATRASQAARTFLRAHHYPQNEVRIEAGDFGKTTPVRMDIRLGPKMDVGEIVFSGNDSIARSDLIKQLDETRPSSFWAFWSHSGVYAPELVLSDIENLRRYYQSRGFAGVKIGEPEVTARTMESRVWPVPLERKKQKLSIRIPIVEGPHFELSTVSFAGDAKASSRQVGKILDSIRAPAPYDLSLLESKRQKIIETLGSAGYAFADVRLEQTTDEAGHTVSAVYRIDAGDPVVIGRIRFEGNNRIPDKFLRRELSTQEGEVFNYVKLDESLKKLNRSGLIKEINRSDVSMKMDEGDDALDVIFKVKEKDRQGIFATGGTGGIGGGYIGVLYTAFNLLGLGEDLSMQLDGGAAQSNFLLNMVGHHFLGFPFTLGLSFFDRVTNYNIASMVPDTTDLVNLLRRHSIGTGISGAYDITPRVRVGLGALVQRVTVDENGGMGVPGWTTGTRTDLTPSLVFDSTTGSGPERRGFLLGGSNSWSGAPFVNSLLSTSQSLQASAFLDDPLSSGRNSFALHFGTALTRPYGNQPLNLDQRFYPGDETVRGFRRGGLSAWGLTSGDSPSLYPIGSDTLIGFSAEYRVPIYGPLSGTAFFDLGYSSLSQRSASSPDLSLIEKTSGLLRASMGGELRLQLPIVHQPARLTFAFNPLRLDEWIESKGSLLRLADPRSMIHFSLGDLF